MSDEVVITPTEDVVVEGTETPTQDTAPKAAVSTPDAQTGATPTNQQTASQPRKSDAEARIAALMSEKDKLAHKNAEIALELVNYKQQLAALQKSHTSAVDDAGKKALAAIDQSRQLTEQLEAANGEIRKLQTLLEHPDLRPFASLIPATTDEEKLAATIDTLLKARQADRQEVVEQIKAGTVPASQPHKLGTQPSPEAIDQYLREAWDNPKEYDRRLAEVTAQLPVLKR